MHIVSMSLGVQRLLSALRGQAVSTLRWACRIEDLNTALEIVKIVLPAYETLFDMPYPLSKMDLVAIPDFEAGAMENWGLLLFRETTLLASKLDSSIDSLRGVTLTIAHEMSHMVRFISFASS